MSELQRTAARRALEKMAWAAVGLALLWLVLGFLPGCAATLHGGAYQTTQGKMAEEDSKDTKALADAFRALAEAAGVSADAKAMGFGMTLMAYQAKQHGNHFQARTWDSPVERNWVQAVRDGVLGWLLSSAQGSEKTVIDRKSDSSFIERVTTTTSSVEKTGQ